MTGKQLKNSILQLAIQGKLVPQDANDEPASVLLQRIRKEKEELLKQGKLKKKDLVTTPISDEEKPFEIPESWEWCRLGDLFIHASGKQQSSSNKKEGKLHKFITTSNLYWGRFDLDVVKEMNFTDEEVKTCSATKGDLLVCEGGAGYGRSAIWPYDNDICLQNHVHRLRPLVNGTCEYVYHFIYLLKETNQLQSVGTAMPGLSANRLKGLLIPLPPLSEQHRIVAKIEELMLLVEEYDKAQTQLDALNQKLPEALKKSILQEAIMGKLVPQDPNDEPASKLLERIRKEKEQLVKDGKLKKKDLVTTPISDEEKPFEIPESWEWCRLGDIVINRDSERVPLSVSVRQQQRNKIFDYYGPGGAFDKVDDYLFDKRLLLIGEDGANLLTRTKPNAFFAEGKYWVNNHVHVLDSCVEDDIILDYIAMRINGMSLADYVTGTAQPKMNQEKLNSILVPLPPLSEQHRIVAKIEELFAQLRLF